LASLLKKQQAVIDKKNPDWVPHGFAVIYIPAKMGAGMTRMDNDSSLRAAPKIFTMFNNLPQIPEPCLANIAGD
jgi:hypothetical protein